MDDNNSNVINTINDIDGVLSETVGDIDVDWYEEVDLSVLHINKEFLCEGFSNAYIFCEEDTYSTTDTIFCDDETIPISNVSNNTFDRIHFYDQPWAQIDNRTKCSVTSNIDLLWNVQYIDDKNKPHMYMKGATSAQPIVPESEGKLQVKAMNKDGY